MSFFLGTQERVRNSRGKPTINVRAIEVLLYYISSEIGFSLILLNIPKSISVFKPDLSFGDGFGWENRHSFNRRNTVRFNSPLNLCSVNIVSSSSFFPLRLHGYTQSNDKWHYIVYVRNEHCKKIRRFYGKIPGIWLPVLLPLFLRAFTCRTYLEIKIW